MTTPDSDLRAEVAALRARATAEDWGAVRRGAWLEPLLKPVLLAGEVETDDARPLEDFVLQVQSRLGAAAAPPLEAQSEDLIEGALEGALPEALQECVGRAFFAARELGRLARRCRVEAGHPPGEADMPDTWELFAAVAGVTVDDFRDDEPTLPDETSAAFGLRIPAGALAAKVGERFIRNALWQTAVPHVGQIAWAGGCVLAARQVAQLSRSLYHPEADRTALLNYGRMHFEQAARLIVLGMWSMAVSDCSLHWSELEAINKVCAVLDVPWDTVRTMRSRSDVVEGEFLNDLERLALPEARRLVHGAVVAAALADGRLAPAELDYLRRISERLQEPFDEADIRRRMEIAKAR